MSVPPELLSIYNDETEFGRHFRKHIRMYNHIFAFTSMGVHLDGDLANGREGVYSFRAQGAIYHKIGGFLHSSSERPRFLQLYIYDTDNEINNRVTKNLTLNVELVERLRSILDVHNPFVHRFRQLAQEPNIESCQLIICEQPRNRPQYNLPTASIVGGEEVGQLNGRNIIVQSHSGHLMNVPDTAGYYDPLQYPLLLPCGTYGWDVNTQNGAASRTKVTCRDYYSYMLQGDDCYPLYQMRDMGQVPLGRGRNVCVDNSWVVPYNPWLLLKYNCHINVEICSSVMSVKYLYKYIHKGSDRVNMMLCPESNIDEVKQYIDARWMCAPEALRRIYKFPMSRIYPTVERLQIHMPNMQRVQFNEDQSVYDILANERNTRTQLTEYFRMNRAKDFDNLLTYNGIKHHTFKEVATQRGLLENDDTIRQCLQEAPTFRSPVTLRRLFVAVLLYCQPTGVMELWNEFNHFMMEDYPSSSNVNNVRSINRLLRDLDTLLSQHGKHIANYDLLALIDDPEGNNDVSKCIEDELSIPVSNTDMRLIDLLNNDQKSAFKSIIDAIEQGRNATFFVDGLGGTGGRTAHSRFKIPLSVDASTTCSISKNSNLAELIRRLTIIIWDEAPMMHRYAFESVDRTFRDITSVDSPFGGKIVILGGDFRHFEVLHLKQNMRSINDQGFSEWLLRVGDGMESVIENDMIKIPPDMGIPWEGEDPVNDLIDHVFPDLSRHMNDPSYMVERAILTLTNEEVDKLNDRIIAKYPGDDHILYLFDSVDDDPRNLY
ncbi:DNA helicase PIF1, ATP-dependent [Senna tora]|uniref:ATP-dependent DNA helicase n=1 Tax=Senna tora TaxID=362788 RepID=A0A834X7L7_9FABA|nr:DNA helicase PIF1, ATP-dependent [Senna tora]